MANKLIISLFIFVFLNKCDLFSQEEQPTIYYDYVKINENAKKIKDAKIKKATMMLVTKDSEDTVNIAYYDGMFDDNNTPDWEEKRWAGRPTVSGNRVMI